MAKRSTERVLNDEIAAADLAVTKARELAEAKLAALKAAAATAHDAHNALVMTEARAVRARKALDAYLPLPFVDQATADAELDQAEGAHTVKPSRVAGADVTRTTPTDGCPACDSADQVMLATDWREAVLPIVGCGNPWHYTDANGIPLSVDPAELAEHVQGLPSEVSSGDASPAKGR